jgi:hypothetical protein
MPKRRIRRQRFHRLDLILEGMDQVLSVVVTIARLIVLLHGDEPGPRC